MFIREIRITFENGNCLYFNSSFVKECIIHRVVTNIGVVERMNLLLEIPVNKDELSNTVQVLPEVI